MATKGYVVMRFSGPHGAPGVNEAWNEALRKLYAEHMAEWKAAGGTGWRTTIDVFGNSPRTQAMFEFETVEQALAWYVRPKGFEWLEAFRKLGTLDLEMSVHRLSNEG